MAPREVRDLVNRACRVAGFDPGTAAAIAESVVAEEVRQGGAIARCLDALAAGDDRAAGLAPSPVARTGQDHSEIDEAMADAFRQGLPVTSGDFAALKAAAEPFLVSERELDAASERPVD